MDEGCFTHLAGVFPDLLFLPAEPKRQRSAYRPDGVAAHRTAVRHGMACLVLARRGVPQWRPGIGGGTAALACAALPGQRHRAVDLPDWAVTSSQLPFGLILEDKEPPSVEMMEGGIFTDDNCLISWNFTLFLSDV